MQQSRRSLVLGALGAATLLTGCARGEQQRDTMPSARPEEPRRPGIRFAPDTLRASSKVGELVVDSIRSKDVAAGRDAASAYFHGEIALDGQTMANPDADLRLTAVCFEADSASAARMPRWEGDERRPWFCFTNSRDAKRLLAGPADVVAASIVIDRFTIHYGVSDEVNSARLVRVLRSDGSR